MAELSLEEQKKNRLQSPCFSYGVKDDKNCGTHGDSSFMLDGLPSSRENPLKNGECQMSDRWQKWKKNGN